MNKSKEEKIWKIINLIEWTSSYFKKHGIDSYRLKTELLLAHVLNSTRLELYQYYDKPVSKDELAVFKSYIKRVLAGEPLQMIIGKVPFFNVEIFVNSQSIVPRPETETLAAMIVEDCKDKKDLKILDIGTGSGCIALSLAKAMPDAQVTAVDVSNDALELAEKNKKYNKIENVTFFMLDVSKEFIDGKFDIIVSNPPYIEIEEYNKLEREVKDWEPKFALTDGGDGLSFYRKFADVFKDILVSDGTFYLEIGWGQAENIRDIFESKGYSIKIYDDDNKIPRFIRGDLSSF